MKTRTLLFVCLAVVGLAVAYFGYQSFHPHSTDDGLTVTADNSPATNSSGAAVPSVSTASSASK